MSFSYSGNPKQSELDALRFLTGDTSANTCLISNEELQYILDTYTGTAQRLAVAFRQGANKLAHKATKRSLGPQSEDATETFRYYSKEAARYEKLATYGNLPALPEMAAKVFDKGMMSNVSSTTVVE